MNFLKLFRRNRKLNPLNCTHDQAVAFYERYRANMEAQVDHIKRYIEPHKTVIDVGAGIGMFSKIIAEKTNHQGPFDLFEPVRNICKIGENYFRDGAWHEFGLGDEKKDGQIYLSSDGNIGWNTLIKEKAARESAGMIIELEVFDRWWSRAMPPVTFIKIDVEGYEHHVLRGMMNTIWRDRPTIFCEVGWGKNHPEHADREKVFRKLRSMRYEFYGENQEGTADVLMLPSEKEKPWHPEKR